MLRQNPVARLLLLTIMALSTPHVMAQEEEGNGKRFELIAQRYHRLIARRPRKGTAFNLLYRHYLDAGRLADLVKHYEGQAKKNPQQASTQMVLGLIYERRGRLAAALKHVEAAVKLSPNNFYPKYAAALLMERQYQRVRAIPMLELAIKNKPDRAMLMDIYKRLGRLHLAQGNKKKALQTWSKLVEAFPGNVRVLQELAELLAVEEQFDESIKRYQQLVKNSADNLFRKMSAQIEIGQIQVRQGKLQTAIATFESCLAEVKPTGWIADDLRRRIESVFLRGGDLAGLVSYYEGRLKKHPQDLASMTKLAETLGKLGRGKDAVKQYQAALKVAPTRFKIRESLIAELIRQDQLADAIKEAETLVKQRPSDTDAVRRHGQLVLQHGKPSRAEAEKKALEIWKKLAEDRAKDPLAAVQVAELCRTSAGIPSRFGNSKAGGVAKEQVNSVLGKAALHYYQEGVKRSNGAAQYHEYLGEFLYSIDRLEDALQAWRKLAAAPNDTADNLKRLAQVLAGAEQLEEAGAAIDKALEKDGKRYDLHQFASDLHVRREQFAKAEKHLDQMEALADTPELLENSLRQRVQMYASAQRLSAEARKLSVKLNSKSSLRDYWLAAMIASAERRSADALDHLSEALKAEPKHALLLRFKAEVHQQGGDLTGAVAQFRYLAKLEPKNRTAHLAKISQLQLELGQIKEARETAEEIVRLTPGNVESIQRLASIHLRSGEDEKGLQVLRQAVRSAPRDVDARKVLARRLIERQKIVEGVEHLWRAFELTQDLEGKLNLVSQIAEQYIIMDRLAALIQRLNNARQKQQDPFASSLYLVAVYNQAEDYVKARRELNTLLSRRPNDARVLRELVALSESLGDTAQAIKYQQRVVELVNKPKASEKLAQLYSDLGEDKKAEAIWTRLRTRTKDVKSLLSAMDRAGKSGHFKNVISIGSTLWKKRPNDWRLGYRLAMAMFRAGQHENAIKVSQDVLNLVANKAFKPIPKKRPQTNRYRPTYPPLIYRIQAPMMVRRMLQSPHDARSGYSSYLGNFPKDLGGAQQICAMVIYEIKLRTRKQAEYLESLKTQATAKKSLRAMRQLTWIYMSDRLMDQATPFLDAWIKASPTDPEPRFAKFTGSVMVRPPSPGGNAKKVLAEMQSQFEWFEKRHPRVAAFMTGAYSRVLMGLGERKKAAELAKKGLAKAKSWGDLQQVGFVVNELQDLDLMSLMLTKLHQLNKSNRSVPSYAIVPVMQSFTSIAAKKKKYDVLLKSFDKFFTETSPQVIRPGRRVSSTMPSRFPGRMVSPRLIFPTPTAWIDQTRLELLQSVHRSLRVGQKSVELANLAKKRSGELEGVAKQCWQVAYIVIRWLDGERDDALKQLEQFAKSAPGNVELRLLVARALAQSGKPQRALESLKNTQIPFGRLAKQTEQLRLKLANRVDDKETGKKAALRLFGMRLSTAEQRQLAQTLRGYGLVARSDQLIKRAVRTASNNPRELYNLMTQNVSSNPKRALEIARMIIRKVPRSTSTRSSSNSNYRRQALRVLRQHGELGKMVKQAERQLAAAPKSIKVMEALVELYDANGDAAKADKITLKMAQARPKDGKLHYRIAQSYFRRSKFKEGIRHLGTVWKYDPRTALQNGYQLGQYYRQANQLDLLAKHLSGLKGNPALVRYGYQISNIVSNISNQTNDKQAVIKLFRVALDISPPERQLDMAVQFGSLLVRYKKMDLAYDLYIKQLLPQKKVDPQVPVRRVSSYAKNTIIANLAKVAVQLKKQQHLAEEIALAAEKDSAFAAPGQLLEAMMNRRADREEPLAELANLFLTDAKFATSLGEYQEALKRELEQCKTEAALRIAIKVFRKKPVGPIVRSGSNEEIRVAAIYVKLGERETARQTLVKAESAALPPGMPASYAAEQDFRNKQTIARALTQHGFHIDAAAMYHKALMATKEIAPNRSIIRYEVPRAYTSLQQAVTRLLKRPGAHLKGLMAALQKSSVDVNNYFVIADPRPIGNTGSSFSGYVPRRSRGPSKVLSDASSQLLTRLVLHAAQQNKLTPLKAAVAAFRSKAGKDKTKLEQARCLETLIALAAKSAKSKRVLESWLIQGRKEKTLGARAPLWLITLMALKNKETSKTGLDLCFVVAKSAEVANLSARRQSAVSAVAGRSDKYAKTMLKKLLKGNAGDPQTLLQIAQVQFKRRNFTAAVDALTRVWDAAPAMMMQQLRTYVPYYAKAQKIDALAKSIRGVTDANVMRRYSYNVANVMRQMPTTPAQAKHVVELYFAGTDMAPNNAAYIASQFSSYLRKLPKNSETLEVFYSVLFPAKTRDGRFAEFAQQALDTAKAAGKVKEFKARCEAVVKSKKSWQARGQLLLSMIAMDAGDQKPLSEFVKRYRQSPSYAAELQSSSYILRAQLSRSKDPAALQLALDIWKPQAAQEAGRSVYATVEVANLLVRLGKKQEAKTTLISALNVPFSINYQTSPSYLIQMRFRRRFDLAQALYKNGFHRSALDGFARACAIDISKMTNNRSYMQSRIKEAHRQARSAIKHILNKQADQARQDLIKTLNEWTAMKRPMGVDQFFVIFDPLAIGKRRSTRQRGPADHHGSQNAKVPNSLLVPLLKKLQQSGKLKEVAVAVEAAQKRAKDIRISSLAAIVAMLQNDEAKAKTELTRIIPAARQKLSDAAWLVAQEAAQRKTLQKPTAELLKAVIETAGRAQRSTRQQSAIALLLKVSAKSAASEGSIEALRKLIGGSGTGSEIQLATALFNNGNAEHGIKILTPLWKKDTTLMVSRFDELARLYVNNDAGQELLAVISKIKTRTLADRYTYQLLNSASSYASRSKDVNKGMVLYESAVLFASASPRQLPNAARQYARYLRSKKKDQRAFEILVGAVLPPTAQTGTIADVAGELVQAAITVKSVPVLVQATKKAAEKHRNWQFGADLLLALIERETKKTETQFVALIKKYRADSAYAGRFGSSITTLRTELGKCSKKEPLELAAELWRDYLTQLQTQNNSDLAPSYEILAKIYVKLGKRKEAHKTLLSLATAAMPHYSGSYAVRMRFMRRMSAANELHKLGYTFDAIRLWQRNIGPSTRQAVRSYRLQNDVQNQRKSIRDAVRASLQSATKMDELVARLTQTLNSRRPQLTVFFVSTQRAWPRAVIKKMIPSVHGTRTTSLIEGVLHHAYATKKLDPIRERITKLSKGKRPLAKAANILIQSTKTGSLSIPQLSVLGRNRNTVVRSIGIRGLAAQAKQEAALNALERVATTAPRKRLAIEPLAKANTKQSVALLAKWYSTSSPTVRLRIAAVANRRIGSGLAPKLVGAQQVLHDNFNGKHQLKWDILNRDASQASFTKKAGALTLHAATGSFSGSSNNFKNAYLLPNPAEDKDFQITTCLVNFKPSVAFQQGCLLAWADQDNYLKFSFEAHTGGTGLVCFAEQNKVRARQINSRIKPSAKLWLRLTRAGTTYMISTSQDGKTFKSHGSIRWSGKPTKVGFAAVAPGPKPKTIDVSFDSFTLTKFNKAPGKKK